MSFHAGGHKPRLLSKGPEVWFKRRLIAFGGGVVLALAGVFRLGHIPLMGRNYVNQPVYSTDLIAVGAFFALCALIPTSWLEGVSKRSRREK
jgi:hypothetical protein